MDAKKIRVRAAGEADAPDLLGIYAPYVEKTAITFEYQVPNVEEFAGRIRRISGPYPYLIAEADGEILGYAYAGPFHERAAYAWSAEVTVYVDGSRKKMGVGRILYEALENALAAQNIRNLYACIACPPEEDEYLTRNSVDFHRHLGYQTVGEFHRCGYKFGRWYHMVWMEKQIGSQGREPQPVKRFDEIPAAVRRECGIFSGLEDAGVGRSR